jgi:recombination protein RecA
MKKDTKAGKLSIAQMRAKLNKKHGMAVAHDLSDTNPTDVEQWIPTGSRWLNSIICRGKIAGIPVGKISEIAGMEATGKSYMAAQIAANAHANAGCDIENIMYLQAISVEMVLETIETILAEFADRQVLFIWDSLALTPSVTDIEGDFNPLSSMAVKPRILSKGMSKLVVPIANAGATLLVLNQLKTNITSNVAEALTTPYFTPGGKAMSYAYSLRVWLTGRKAKASFITDERGFRIGNEVKAKIEKSRFGTAGRLCNFKIVWGGNVGIQDEESWFEAVKSSEHLTSGGAWYTLKYGDGTEEKFQASRWMEKLQEEKFKARILELMDEEVVLKFDKRLGDASEFYDDENEVVNESQES